jgi:glutathione synthase/RimK-type ligase-like ATP-grasp enzyme
MNKTIFLPYNPASTGLRNLKERTNLRSLRLNNSRWRGDVVINWGNRHGHAALSFADVINHPAAVDVASHKLKAFQALKEHGGINIPVFSTSKEDILSHGFNQVCARTLMRANSGRGLTVHTQEEELPDAPLYVEYVPKQDEYRVHVWGGDVLDIRRKALRRDLPNRDQVDWRIRNHDAGFIFQRDFENDVPVGLVEQAKRAVAALNLDFGAVDIIYNERRDKCYVLEVNTAPGLEGSTVDAYARKVMEVIYS